MPEIILKIKWDKEDVKITALLIEVLLNCHFSPHHAIKMVDVKVEEIKRRKE